MSRNLRLIIGGAAAIAIIALGVFLYATRPLEEPSEDIQDNTEQLSADGASGAAEVVFRIDQENSTVEFNIDEVLAGVDTTVVGTTNEVAGDVRVNLDDPTTSTIGAIRLNARTFKTDRSQRDNAIGRFILQSENDAFEFITFQPNAISGLPESVAVGDVLTLAVSGDLTIKDVTNSVTFSGTVTYTSADQITGSLSTTVLYPDYNLSIPNVPSVTGVEEEVILKIDFVANRVEGEGA